MAVFESPETIWSSQIRSYSPQDPRPVTPSMTSVAKPSTPLDRSQSRPSTPFVEPGSEAARHESFSRPFTPFEDRRREIIEHRRRISTRPETSFDFSRSFTRTSETGSYFGGGGRSRNTTLRSTKSRLPSDNFDFLNRPYEPLPLSPMEHTLESKSSFGSMFVLNKSSAGSLATSHESFNNHNPLGIALKYSRSVEPFPRFSNDNQVSEYPTLKKQVSFGHLEGSPSKNTLRSFKSRASGLAGNGLAEISENEQMKRELKTKRSLPAFRSKKHGEPGFEIGDVFFVETGDEYERFVTIPAPPPRKRKQVHKSKSFASFISGRTSEKTIKPRKSSLFRREPDGEKITSKNISESFPVDLHKYNDYLNENEETRCKEYTRKWLLEESRAKKFDLNRPAGDPMKEPEKESMMSMVPMFIRRKKKPLPPFEFPRATPRPLVRPNRQRWDSIFPRRALPPKAKPTTHIPIDLSKYTKYPGLNPAL